MGCVWGLLLLLGYTLQSTRLCFSSITPSDSFYPAVIPWAVQKRGQTFLGGYHLDGSVDSGQH